MNRNEFYAQQRDINQSEFGFVENEDLLNIFGLD